MADYPTDYGTGSWPYAANWLDPTSWWYLGRRGGPSALTAPSAIPNRPVGATITPPNIPGLTSSAYAQPTAQPVAPSAYPSTAGIQGLPGSPSGPVVTPPGGYPVSGPITVTPPIPPSARGRVATTSVNALAAPSSSDMLDPTNMVHAYLARMGLAPTAQNVHNAMLANAYSGNVIPGLVNNAPPGAPPDIGLRATPTAPAYADVGMRPGMAYPPATPAPNLAAPSTPADYAARLRNMQAMWFANQQTGQG